MIGKVGLLLAALGFVSAALNQEPDYIYRSRYQDDD